MKFAKTKDDELGAILATNLRRARTKRGMEQRKAAAALDMDVNQISRWERAVSTPHAIALARLADLYDVPMDILFVQDHPSLPEDSGADGMAAGSMPPSTTSRRRRTSRQPPQ